MKLAFNRFLLICTGNICRSPMAEYFLREALAGAEDTGSLEVASAGIGALVGEPADDKALAVMAEKDIDMSAHRGRQLDLDIAGDFELLLVMEPHQQRWIEGRFPVLRGRVQRLGHWLDRDVPDPYQHPVETFRSTRDLIEEMVASWVLRLQN